MFNTLAAAQEWIENIHRFGDKLDLIRMENACRMLDHPERSFRTIHVGGTNGKGSTANYIKNILVQAGFKVGIYTSPYVVRFNERIGIDHVYISDQDVIRYSNILFQFWHEYEQIYHDQITFFEVLTLMGFLYFRDQEVSYAVIEVGLGGLLDATNVIVPEVACITNISYDHMRQLGNTLESIALNKLGIVKEGGVLVTTIEDKSLYPLFYSVTARKNARLKIVDLTQVSGIHVGEITTFSYRDQTYQLVLPGLHQVKNAVLAIEVIRYLRLKNHLKIRESHIFQGLFETRWPGRFEIFNDNIILDGAHNIGGFEALRQTILAMYHDRYVKCLFCMMKDKEHVKIIPELDNLVDEIYFTEIDYPRRANAIDLFNESFHPKKYVHTNAKDIFLSLSHSLQKNEILLVTGSLYFISEIRKIIMEEKVESS
jgi:dihydrofolate synthase/folylpolyglutamate synthase